MGSLAALMRGQGSRVGVGELLGAHRALAAVDAASREDSKLALRAVLCSTRADLDRFELAFEGLFGSGLSAAEEGSLAELGSIERAALPRAAIPGDTAGKPSEGLPPLTVP